MAYSRRSYKGAPVSNSVLGSLTATATSIALSSPMSGWATGSAPFFVVIDPGTTKEEKVCVIYASAEVLTVVDPLTTGGSGWTTPSENGRGVDDTTPKAHDPGASIYPVFTATEANQANELVSKYTVNGDIVVHGTTGPKTISTGGSGNNNKVLVADSTVADGGVKWAQVTSDGITDASITAAKIASAVAGSGLAGGAGTALSVNVDDSTIEINSDALRLKDGGVTSGKIANDTIVDADIKSDAAIALSKLANGAHPTEITVASANIVNGTIVEEDLANSAVTSAKIADLTIVAGDIAAAAVTNAKLNNGASGDIPLVTVSTSDPTGGKNGDIWVKVV